MKITLLAAAVLSVGLSCASVPATAAPHHDRDRYDRDRYDHRWRGDERNWDPARAYDRRGYRHERRMTREDRIYRGRDGRYYCRRPDGTTGLVVGGIGGALIGHAIGGDTLGTLLGAAGGAALGRSIERGQVRCR
jgi:hypothetical protein